MITQASAVVQIGRPPRGAEHRHRASSQPQGLARTQYSFACGVRFIQGIRNREQFLVAGFIAEIASASTLDANARGVNLTVTPVEDGLAIEADRQGASPERHQGGIVTKSAPSPKSRVCLYCGLPSGVTSHGNVGEVWPGSVATH